MDAILYELRDHSCALNAGRWDYIFCCIKKTGAVLPDRAQVTMTVPFMRAYTELLVKTCHRRGAHAIGGMAAFIPSRRDPGGERDRAREGGRGQAARGRRRLRRHVGRASGPRPVATIRRRLGDGRTSSTGSATTSQVPRGAAARLRRPGRRDHRRGAAPERLASASATSTPGCSGVGAAAIDNLMEDVGDRRDLARAGLVVGAAGRFDEARVRAEIAAVEAGDEAKEVFADVALATTVRGVSDDLCLRPPAVSLESTKADDIAVLIEEAIVSGELAPGSVLRQEQLSERFGVSPHSGSRGPAAARGARSRLVRAEPRRARADACRTTSCARRSSCAPSSRRSRPSCAATRMTDEALAELEAAERRFAAADARSCARASPAATGAR